MSSSDPPREDLRYFPPFPSDSIHHSDRQHRLPGEYPMEDYVSIGSPSRDNLSRGDQVPHTPSDEQQKKPTRTANIFAAADEVADELSKSTSASASCGLRTGAFRPDDVKAKDSDIVDDPLRSVLSELSRWEPSQSGIYDRKLHGGSAPEASLSSHPSSSGPISNDIPTSHSALNPSSKPYKEQTNTPPLPPCTSSTTSTTTTNPLSKNPNNLQQKITQSQNIRRSQQVELQQSSYLQQDFQTQQSLLISDAVEAQRRAEAGFERFMNVHYPPPTTPSSSTGASASIESNNSTEAETQRQQELVERLQKQQQQKQQDAQGKVERKVSGTPFQPYEQCTREQQSAQTPPIFSIRIQPESERSRQWGQELEARRLKAMEKIDQLYREQQQQQQQQQQRAAVKASSSKLVLPPPRQVFSDFLPIGYQEQGTYPCSNAPPPSPSPSPARQALEKEDSAGSSEVMMDKQQRGKSIQHNVSAHDRYEGSLVPSTCEKVKEEKNFSSSCSKGKNKNKILLVGTAQGPRPIDNTTKNTSISLSSSNAKASSSTGGQSSMDKSSSAANVTPIPLSEEERTKSGAVDNQSWQAYYSGAEYAGDKSGRKRLLELVALRKERLSQKTIGRRSISSAQGSEKNLAEKSASSPPLVLPRDQYGQDKLNIRKNKISLEEVSGKGRCALGMQRGESCFLEPLGERSPVEPSISSYKDEKRSIHAQQVSEISSSSSSSSTWREKKASKTSSSSMAASETSPFNRPQNWGEFSARYSPPIGSSKKESVQSSECAECGTSLTKLCEHEVERLGWVDARDDVSDGTDGEGGAESGFESEVDDVLSEAEWDII